MSRRIDRKQKKCQHVVEKETGIKCTSTATKYIAICNAGLVNGLSEEIIYEEFSKFGSIETISMLPGKSCCFVALADVETSMKAFQSINGILNIGQNNKPIYLSYTEDILKEHQQRCNPPPGLVVLENYITETEENLLLSLNDFDREANAMKLRQVKHYGYEFRYDINNVDKDCPLKEDIPTECDFLWARLKLTDAPFKNFEPDQLTVNCYKSGQGIPPHVDTHSAFEDPLMVVSLGTSVIMSFKNGNDCYPLYLPQRSLAIISGESRYNWTHGITPRKLDVIPKQNGLYASRRGTRVSYTFRKVRKGECNCEYVEKCDSYINRCEKRTIENDLAVKLERTHVHDVYENIAAHFSDTRHKAWPNVLKFLQSLKMGSIVVDVGCGNGKYLGRIDDIFCVGCDNSFGLLEICKQRGFEAFTCTCLKLPIKNESADAVICIAVIHHLANDERRLQAIKEIVRILRVNGRALIYVWAKNQNKNDEKTSYLKQDRKNRKRDVTIPSNHTADVSIGGNVSLPVHTNRKEFSHQDVLVPWKLKHENADGLFLRFYHVFEENELERLCLLLDNIKIVQNYYDQGNWCCVLEKIK